MIGKAWARRIRTLVGRPSHDDPTILVGQPPAGPAAPGWHRFDTLVKQERPASVLEIGTLRSMSDRSTHHQAMFPWVARPDYVMADIQAGQDVDVVADLHALPAEWADRFGAFVASAVFEHLERPWIAAREAARVLVPGGLFVVATHQTFPLHGYPNDFFRFSKEALALILTDAGLEVIDCSYGERCKIVPAGTVVPGIQLEEWNTHYPSYVHVVAIGRKPR